MSLALEALDVSKTYRGGRRALDGLSISAETKTVFSLLGKNGAGKTTFTKIASTILRPSRGSISVLGLQLEENISQIRKRISVVPQEGRPYSLQTPYEHVLMFLVARGWSLGDARIQARRTLEQLDLWEYNNTICSALSGGLKQRVVIAMAVSVRPELIFLDEPTIGLDPIARMTIWEIVREMIDDGTTVLLTTHYMDEAETLSNRIAIVDAGHKVAEGTAAELKATLSASTTVLLAGQSAGALTQSCSHVYRNGSNYRVFTDEDSGRDLAERALDANLAVSVRPVNLEDVFINLVGESDGS